MTLPSVEEMKSRMTNDYWVNQALSAVERELLQADPMSKHIVFSLGSVPNSKRDVVRNTLLKELHDNGFKVREVKSNHTFIPSLYIGWEE